MKVFFKQASCQLDFLKGPSGKYAVINEVFVPPKYRGKGLATALIHNAIEIARKKGCYKVLCWSRFSNGIAHGLYKKTGFKKWGYEYRLDLS